jgi:hypothetical protein
LLVKAIEQANTRLAGLGMEPIGKVSPHGLRRTYASLRCAVGDDVPYTASQLGHEDPTFTLKTYTHAVKRRNRLTGHEKEQFERAMEWAQWAQMGTNGEIRGLAAVEASMPEEEKAPR